eukprot:CAMPEP_0115848742 /NCGR_PEP_ID=MMETSP0287-20121206/11084_1 /TAXON_ID=412157 /ORGANISM="Chrysochromulina rotalis, Strain UIO044" /LENGTH=888 /DNA_ID=CAMNT_0003302675 /DNA_START=17 /DNA_END=2683 /DNA_ORIENTATION=+
MTTAAGAGTAAECWLLRWCISRSMKRDVDTVLTTLGSDADAKSLLSQNVGAGSATSLFVSAMCRFPTVASRLHTPAVVKATQLLIDESASSSMSTGQRTGLKSAMSSWLTDAVYGTVLRNLQAGQALAECGSGAVGTAEVPADPSSHVAQIIQLLANTHSTAELPFEVRATIRYFLGRLEDCCKRIAHSRIHRYALRVFLVMVPRRLVESVLQWSTSQYATEWFLEVLLKRRSRFGGHSLLYHLLRQLSSAREAKSSIAERSAALSPADSARLKDLLATAAPHMARGGDPKLALSHVIRAHESLGTHSSSGDDLGTHSSSGDDLGTHSSSNDGDNGDGDSGDGGNSGSEANTALRAVLDCHIDRLQVKALHRLADRDDVAIAARELALALQGPLIETLRDSGALHSVVGAIFDVLHLVARGPSSTAAETATGSESREGPAPMPLGRELEQDQDGDVLLHDNMRNEMIVDDIGDDVDADASLSDATTEPSSGSPVEDMPREHAPSQGHQAIISALAPVGIDRQLRVMMDALVDSLFVAVHDAALHHPTSCAPYIHWLLHESFVLMLQPHEIEAHIGMSTVLDELERVHGASSRSAALAEASSALEETRDLLHGLPTHDGASTQPPIAMSVASWSTSPPPALAPLEQVFDARLRELLADLLARQQRVREGPCVQPAPTAVARAPGGKIDPGSPTVDRPIVGLEISHGDGHTESLKAAGFEPVCTENDEPMANHGSMLWCKRSHGMTSDTASEMVAPIAEIRVTTSATEAQSLRTPDGAWVCIAKSFSMSNADLRLWYRRCSRGPSGELHEAPLTRLAYSTRSAPETSSCDSGPPTITLDVDLAEAGACMGRLGRARRALSSYFARGRSRECGDGSVGAAIYLTCSRVRLV